MPLRPLLTLSEAGSTFPHPGSALRQHLGSSSTCCFRAAFPDLSACWWRWATAVGSHSRSALVRLWPLSQRFGHRTTLGQFTVFLHIPCILSHSLTFRFTLDNPLFHILHVITYYKSSYLSPFPLSVQSSVQLPLAFPTVPHASAALVASGHRLVVQCDLACEVAKRAQACAITSDGHQQQLSVAIPLPF
jgi:hypothetical protein